MLAVLLGLLLGILILLAIPFEVVFRLTKDDSVRLRLSVAWAFGLLSKDLGKTGKQMASKSKTKKSPRKQPAKGIGKSKAAMAFMRSPGMPARLLRLARDTLRQIHVRQLYLRLILGLDDPADTGRLYGVLVPTLVQATRWSRLDLQVQPDFSRPILLVNGCARVRVIPITVIGVMLGFLLSPTCWRAFAAVAKVNKS